MRGGKRIAVDVAVEHDAAAVAVDRRAAVTTSDTRRRSVLRQSCTAQLAAVAVDAGAGVTAGDANTGPSFVLTASLTQVEALTTLKALLLLPVSRRTLGPRAALSEPRMRLPSSGKLRLVSAGMKRRVTCHLTTRLRRAFRAR